MISKSPKHHRRYVRQGLCMLKSEHRLYRMPLKRATLLSTVFHVLGPIALLAFLMLVLQLPLWDWLKHKTPSSDLTFVLVRDTQEQPPDKALFKGNANQRAGGKKDPIKQPKPAEGTPAGGSGRTVATQPKPPKLSKTPNETIKPISAPEDPVKTEAQTAPPTIATVGKPEAVSAVAQTTDEDLSGGSLSGGPEGKGDSSQGSGRGNSVGAGVGYGALGNAQGGNGGDGVDVAADADFGPFMAELKKRILLHWTPPRGHNSRMVKLVFYLARDGKLVKIETKTTSGDEETDLAAIAAVQASMPFIAFPSQVKEDVLPIEYTFDYNVLNPKNTKRGLKW